ncbi:hypothetical protein SAMN05660649_02330 [Desulfotomaculum arcticum]|uniref:Uncharacterized protein n=1 Tax=Desulfotruncus arcticus DSM 17038 TaxID=1121424 RepID=A0A1I2TR91_9FIRM|nr:hypothetical protein [Desulfotruncus arcticus]SFG65907.1 hypothetical protein SAMN05660649_02330 [Desulfotomaculum arcticum] [Desulfotruncus arcticus DSM 17038]
MQGNTAAIHRTYERKAVVLEKPKQREKPFIDRVMHWLESEEPAGQHMAGYGFLALTALYFIGAILRAVF